MQGNQRQALRIAYCAGIIDGEGTICVTRTKPQQKKINPTYGVLLRVGMNTKEPLDFLLETFQVGHFFYEGVRKNREQHKPMMRWAVVNRDQVVQVIDQILPYLLVKKEQALLVKEMCQGWQITPNKGGRVPQSELQRRHDYYMRCKSLNSLGAAATTKPKNTSNSEAIV